MEATWARLRALDDERPWLLDAVLAALLFAGAVLSAALGTQTRAPDATYVALVAAGAAPYLLRRRAPLAVLVVASVPVLAVLALGYTSAVIGSGLFLAAYSVAAWSDGRRTVLAAGWVVVVLVGLVVVEPEAMAFGELATNAALFGARSPSVGASRSAVAPSRCSPIAPSSRSARGSRSPDARSRTSGCGSHRSCTTSSGTRSA